MKKGQKKDLCVAILYKNHSYKIVSAKKLRTKDLYKSDVKTIMIPCLDDLNVYIPIRPNKQYEFATAKVRIDYETYVYDMEADTGEHFTPKVFEKECTGIIEFINAIYNAYKFRGTSIYIEGNVYEGMHYVYPQWVVYSRRIQVKFLDATGHEIDSIDSGDMGLLDMTSKKTKYATPPPYACEDRLECLNDILYTPCDYRESYHEVAAQRLPVCILTRDDFTWKKVKRPTADLTGSDYIFYKLDDFGVYYYLDYQLFLDIMNMTPFDIHLISSPIHPEFDPNFLPSLGDGKAPSASERRQVLDAYISDEIVSVLNIKPEIANVNTFLVSKAFLVNIAYYIHYFATLTYGNEDPSCRIIDLIIFARSFKAAPSTRLLTLPELTHQSSTDMFLDMLTSQY